MKNNKYKIIELFIYVIIVIAGLVLLITGKAKGPEPPDDATPPPAQVTIQSGERWNDHAALLNWKG
jgi:cell division protein YceG involved in septum cleavage